MSRRTFSFVAVCLSFVITAARFPRYNGPIFVPGDFTEIESYISTAMQHHNIPGLALAVTLGDQMVYSKGFGTTGDGRISDSRHTILYRFAKQIFYCIGYYAVG